MKKILDLILIHQDNSYGDFIHKLTPTLPREYFIGVKTPDLRKIVKEITIEDKELFLNELPHKYYEENMLHGFIISEIKDYDKAIYEINKFLPYVNNWATSDTMYPRIFKKHLDTLLPEIKKWVNTESTYHKRFGVDMLMTFYLDDNFSPDHFEIINSIQSDEYYVKMMIAWYYATALAKQYDNAIKVIESKTLDKWVHNKSIQKAIESFRVSEEHKEYIRTLKQV